MIRGLVIRGSRNIFTIRPEGEDGPELMECRIKGKVLKGVDSYYNPLAPGDRVLVERDPVHAGKGLITALEERKNCLTRLNQKALGPKGSASSQLLAANVDMVCCVTSPASPPFRPRFLDRLLVQAEAAGIKAVIICNKYDLEPGDPDVEERLEDFRRIGYPVYRVSARTGDGIGELRELFRDRLLVLTGQSGVGKSSLINALSPEMNVKAGSINEKYDRGNHTTSMSVLLEVPLPPGSASPADRAFIIDTPGIRRLAPDNVSAEDLIYYMKEFSGLAGKCSYGLSCSHQTEPGCKILEAVAAGYIHEDRYESFLRIREELPGNHYE